MIQPVVLCGGSGTRLWPLSRPDRPKPFLPLLGERTLFQQTLDRTADRSRFSDPIIVAGGAHTRMIANQAGPHHLIVEPDAKNTAPAIALAAARVPRETVLLVCPSDHHIGDEVAFLEGIEAAKTLAEQGMLVCFGIAPDRPETGYGYIERGEALETGHVVSRFVEKPDSEAAERYLASGKFVWNGGIFLFRAGDYLDELAKHRPDMATLVDEAVAGGRSEGDTFYPGAAPFGEISSESVDYAVMEATERAAVVSADMGWSDIGDWNALMLAREAAGLDLCASGTQSVEAGGIMTVSDGPQISVVGLNDVIVVADGDEVLVLSRDAAQSVRQLKPADRT
ncbi:mannose-1-phosphate guanylyltransferase [Qipengyuania aquimaris]|uniref:mannose-1-phosphate guanylyltransferase n=1 Tax=Qipengyuania aquimaris TaxID=255984 RepID=UPI001FD31BFF|nr:sugar phosphate nucleotidyltransferase [Qipengyuania aquimaris]UOR15723.1 sugar phosphate nucleotidyltransferase [Qipengyuania aquimaris]